MAAASSRSLDRGPRVVGLKGDFDVEGDVRGRAVGCRCHFGEKRWKRRLVAWGGGQRRDAAATLGKKVEATSRRLGGEVSRGAPLPLCGECREEMDSRRT